MTAGGDLPERVLVVRCPDWPAAGREPGAAGGEAAPGSGAVRDTGPGAAEFGQVVSVVEGFCPRVEVLHPGACAIGARGPARYFGGEGTLAVKIIEAVAGGGFACQVGIADGLFAALLAAGHAQRPRDTRRAQPGAVMRVPPGHTRAFLAPLPVSVLDSPDLTDLLPRLGIRTLGEFASLPAAEVANRFGTPGVIAHRLARGLDRRPLAPRPPSADLSVGQEFDPPVRLAEPVVFAAKALAERMHNGLAASGLACVRVQVQVAWGNGQEITRLWRHDGLLSALAVAERVRWQLASSQASPPPATAGGERTTDDFPGGITMLRLIPDQLVRDHGRQLGLWGDAVVSDRVARAAVRVQAMLGHGAVTRPVPTGGRSPAEQVTLVPFGDTNDRMPSPGGAAGPGSTGRTGGAARAGGLGGAVRPWPGRIPAPFPATVYPAPLPARIADESGVTVAVSGRGLVSAPPARMSADGAPWLAVTAWTGPWPVTEWWWHPRAARRRARFQLVTEDGAAWLVAVQDGGWLIEARYD
ncbi:MAG TPA: DNA polymerase Y family protein [Streptosporangiaceae bacterium]|jgi:protein ImuB|nr:DNA polymerase Y family protein [Streptosporangiaceae bacterium]